MSDQGINYEIWTPPNSGSFVRKHDITAWVLPGTTWDVRLKELPAGQLIVHRDCPYLDDILYEDRADHTNDVGSTLMMFRDGVWLGAMVPTSRDDDVSSEDAPVTFGLEGLEWYLDKARVEPYDHPADPIREGDWIYGHPTILTPAGGEISDARWSLYVDGASSGTFTITDGTDTTSNISWDEDDPSVIKTRLETDITAITSVVVSGAGTSANEFFIRLTDPSGTDLDLSVNDSTNGTVVLSKTTAGGTPSPRPWHGSIDGTTGDVIGTYEAFQMVEAGVGSAPSAPAGSSSTYLLKIDADTPATAADYAGGQVEVEVIWGHRYWGSIQVYSEASQRIRFVIRDISDNEMASDDQTLSADTWTELDFTGMIPNTGIDIAVYRVGIVVDGDAEPIYVDANEAIFAPGAPAAPFGEITNDLLAPIQTRSVLDWITETFSDTQDSTSEAWDRDLAVRVRRGQSFYQWLEYGSRWGYERSIRWDGTNWDFGLYNPGNLGTDYTGQGGPTVSPFDGGVGASPYVQRVPDFTTAIAEGDAGTWGEYTDADLATGWGRLEGYFANRQNVGDDLDSLAQQMVTDTTDEAVSHRQTVQNPTVLPLEDVLVGDTVPVLVRKPDGTVTPEMLRCVMIAVEETETLPVYTYHFGSSVFDADQATQEALRSLIRRYQALDEIGDGGGTVEPLAISSPVPSTATEATAGSLADGSRKYEHNGTDTTGHDWLIPSGTSAGDMIWAAIQVFGGSQSITSKPSGYTALVDHTNTNVDAAQDYVFYKIADGTETDATFEIASGDKISALFWRTESNGVTFGTPEVVFADTTMDPSPITPSAAGDYAVYTVSHVNKGQPTAASTGYEQVGFAFAENAARRPKTYVQQNAVAITTSEDPGLIDWADTGVFRAYRTWTIALRLDVGTPAVAAGDHTHVEADITDLDHWTEADHDALDHTGLTGVGGSGDVTVAKAGTEVGTRGRINFIEGTDITLTVTDDSGNDEIDVTIASTASGGGGGSTVPEWMELLAAPGSAHGDDQEFTGTIGGTAVTPAGTATWTQDEGLLSVAASSQSTGDHCPRLYPLTPSASPVTLTGRMRLLGRRANNPMIGLCFTDGTTTSSNAVAVGLYQSSSAPTVGRWAGTLTNMTTTNIDTAPPYGFEGTWFYLRLIWTAANTWAWALSPDGVSWTDYGTSTFAATLTPTHFGPWVSSWTQTVPVVGSFEYVRVTESDLSV